VYKQAYQKAKQSKAASPISRRLASSRYFNPDRSCFKRKSQHIAGTAGSDRFAKSVVTAKNESAGGSGHIARAGVVVVVAVNVNAACSGVVGAGPD
jgi:hypothetical protein